MPFPGLDCSGSEARQCKLPGLLYARRVWISRIGGRQLTISGLSAREKYFAAQRVSGPALRAKARSACAKTGVRNPADSRKKKPTSEEVDFLAAHGHPSGWSTEVPERATHEQYSANVRLCQAASPKKTGRVKGGRTAVHFTLGAAGTMGKRCWTAVGRSEHAPRGSRRRNGGGGPQATQRATHSPEPPAGAAGTGGARGRTHRGQQQQRNTRQNRPGATARITRGGRSRPGGAPGRGAERGTRRPRGGHALPRRPAGDPEGRSPQTAGTAARATEPGGRGRRWMGKPRSDSGGGKAERSDTPRKTEGRARSRRGAKRGGEPPTEKGAAQPPR